MEKNECTQRKSSEKYCEYIRATGVEIENLEQLADGVTIIKFVEAATGVTFHQQNIKYNKNPKFQMHINTNINKTFDFLNLLNINFRFNSQKIIDKDEGCLKDFVENIMAKSQSEVIKLSSNVSNLLKRIDIMTYQEETTKTIFSEIQSSDSKLLELFKDSSTDLITKKLGEIGEDIDECKEKYEQKINSLRDEIDDFINFINSKFDEIDIINERIHQKSEDNENFSDEETGAILENINEIVEELKSISEEIKSRDFTSAIPSIDKDIEFVVSLKKKLLKDKPKNEIEKLIDDIDKLEEYDFFYPEIIENEFEKIKNEIIDIMNFMRLSGDTLYNDQILVDIDKKYLKIKEKIQKQNEINQEMKSKFDDLSKSIENVCSTFTSNSTYFNESSQKRIMKDVVKLKEKYKNNIQELIAQSNEIQPQNYIDKVSALYERLDEKIRKIINCINDYTCLFFKIDPFTFKNDFMEGELIDELNILATKFYDVRISNDYTNILKRNIKEKGNERKNSYIECKNKIDELFSKLRDFTTNFQIKSVFYSNDSVRQTGKYILDYVEQLNIDVDEVFRQIKIENEKFGFSFDRMQTKNDLLKISKEFNKCIVENVILYNKANVSELSDNSSEEKLLNEALLIKDKYQNFESINNQLNSIITKKIQSRACERKEKTFKYLFKYQGIQKCMKEVPVNCCKEVFCEYIKNNFIETFDQIKGKISLFFEKSFSNIEHDLNLLIDIFEKNKSYSLPNAYELIDEFKELNFTVIECIDEYDLLHQKVESYDIFDNNKISDRLISCSNDLISKYKKYEKFDVSPFFIQFDSIIKSEIASKENEKTKYLNECKNEFVDLQQNIAIIMHSIRIYKISNAQQILDDTKKRINEEIEKKKEKILNTIEKCHFDTNSFDFLSLQNESFQNIQTLKISIQEYNIIKQKCNLYKNDLIPSHIKEDIIRQVKELQSNAPNVPCIQILLKSLKKKIKRNGKSSILIKVKTTMNYESMVNGDVVILDINSPPKELMRQIFEIKKLNFSLFTNLKTNIVDEDSSASSSQENIKMNENENNTQIQLFFNNGVMFQEDDTLKTFLEKYPKITNPAIYGIIYTHNNFSNYQNKIKLDEIITLSNENVRNILSLTNREENTLGNEISELFAVIANYIKCHGEGAAPLINGFHLVVDFAPLVISMTKLYQGIDCDITDLLNISLPLKTIFKSFQGDVEDDHINYSQISKTLDYFSKDKSKEIIPKIETTQSDENQTKLTNESITEIEYYNFNKEKEQEAITNDFIEISTNSPFYPIGIFGDQNDNPAIGISTLPQPCLVISKPIPEDSPLKSHSEIDVAEGNNEMKIISSNAKENLITKININDIETREKIAIKTMEVHMDQSLLLNPSHASMFIVVLVDVSASMFGSPIESAKIFFRRFADYAASESNKWNYYAIFSFDENVYQIMPLSPLPTDFKNKIDLIEIGKYTELFNGIARSAQHLINNPLVQSISNPKLKIWALTDGASGDLCYEKAKSLIKDNKIQFNIIYLNTGEMIKSATIAKESGGQIMVINDQELRSADLHEYFDAIFQ